MKGQRVLAVILACALSQPALAADPGSQAAELRWSELRPLLADKRIRITLPDGTRLEGDVLAVRADELVLDIRKSSNRQAYAKGQGSIPRAAVSSLRLIRTEGSARVAGGALGGAVGVLVMILGAYYEHLAFAWGGLVAGVPLGIILGYHLGKAADRRVTEIKVVPDAEVQQ